MRRHIRTVRDKHAFKLSEQIGAANFTEDLPTLFKVIQEGYQLSHKADEFNFQTLQALATKVDGIKQRVDTEKKRYEDALESIGNEFKGELQAFLDQISGPVVPTYRSEVEQLTVNSVDPLEGDLVIWASTADNPDDLENLRGTSRPFEDAPQEDADDVILEEESQEVNFELVKNA